MTPSPRSRDISRLGVSTLTAVAGAISLTAVGWFAGAAARQHEAQQARDAVAQASAEAKAARARAKYDAAVARQQSATFPKRVVFRDRPSRTVVHTQYVHAATTPAYVGGGTLTSPAAPAPAPTGPRPGPVSQPAPPPPPPPPPPAPTSGSRHG
jgi:hypothetical protein